MAVPPPTPTAWVNGVTVKLQTPFWVIVNVWPAIVIVPRLDAALVFAVNEYPTLPVPEPLAPLVTVIQESLLVAVHAHVLALAADCRQPMDTDRARSRRGTRGMERSSCRSSDSRTRRCR